MRCVSPRCVMNTHSGGCVISPKETHACLHGMLCARWQFGRRREKIKQFALSASEVEIERENALRKQLPAQANGGSRAPGSFCFVCGWNNLTSNSSEKFPNAYTQREIGWRCMRRLK
jgi:hypothetical protein